MQETKVTIKTDDRSSVIAAFFLGVATTLFIVLYWIFLPNVVVFSFLSLTTLVIFLMISVILARPANTRKVVRVAKIEDKKPSESTKESEKKAKEAVSAKPLPTSVSLTKVQVKEPVKSKKSKTKKAKK